MKTIVGVMLGDEICRDPEQKCKGQGEATIYISNDGGEMIPSCKDCAPPNTHPDPIAEAFMKARVIQ